MPIAKGTCGFCGRVFEATLVRGRVRRFCTLRCRSAHNAGKDPALYRTERRCQVCRADLGREARLGAAYCSVECARSGHPPYGLAASWASVLLKDPCAYCGARSATFDHITARALGGDDAEQNLIGACGGCNSSKGARSLLQFLLATLPTPRLRTPGNDPGAA
jgi:hypothetical protein